MSNVDLFTENIPKWEAERQQRYEQTVVESVIRGLQAQPGLVNRLRARYQGKLSLVLFNQLWPNFPVNLLAYTAKGTISMPAIAKKWQKTSLLTRAKEAYEVYGYEPVAVVFRSRGDELGDMVLHNARGWEWNHGFWRLCLPVGYPDVTNMWVVDPLDGFIGMLRLRDCALEDPE